MHLVDIVIYACWQRKVVTIEQLSQLSSVCNFSAGRTPRCMERTAKPTAGNFRYFTQTVRRGQTVSRTHRQAQPEGSTSARKKSETRRKPGHAGVTKGRWSGWRLAATVVAFTFRRAYSARVNIKRSNFKPVPEATESSQTAGISGIGCYVELKHKIRNGFGTN